MPLQPGMYISFKWSVFNAGLIASEYSPDGELSNSLGILAIEALRLVSDISHKNCIGNDSAQNEILIAELWIKQKEWEKAAQSLDLAEKLVVQSRNITDQAELALCRATLLLQQDGNYKRTQIVRELLDEAEELFLQLGRTDQLEKIRSLRRARTCLA